MAPGSKNAQTPATPVNCSMCAALRLDLKRGRHEFSHNQHITEELHRKIEKLEAIQHMLWAENSSQSQEMSELQERIDEFQLAQSTKDDRIRELEQQVLPKKAQETENNFETSSISLSMAHSATQCSPPQSPREQPNDEFVLRNATLEDEVARLKEQRELELKELTKQWCETQVKLDQEKSAHDVYCLKQRACEESYRQQLRQLEQTLATAQRELAVLRERRTMDAHHVQEVNETNAQLLVQLQLCRDTADQLEEANRALQNSNESFQAEVDGFRAQTTSRSSEAAHLASQLREAQAVNSQLVSVDARLQSELQDRVHQLAEQHHQIQELRKQVAALQQDNERWKHKSEALEGGMTEKSARLQELLNTSVSEQQHLQSQVSVLEWESARNEDFVLKLKNSHVLALERALQSTIRLCVVAPTVNVHLSETPRSESSTFASSSSFTKSKPVVCKPAPPHDRIRGVVENDILPHFTRLIVQEATSEDDKRTHDGGDDISSSIDPWVRDLLQAMQNKITEQLQSVYQTTGA